MSSWSNAEKGYGFTLPDDGAADHSQIQITGYRSFEESQRVQFEMQVGNKGPRAVQIRTVEGS